MIYLNDAAIVGSILPKPAPTVSSPNDGSADVTLTWSFGNAVVSSSPIQITFSARVADVVGNQRPDVLVNNAVHDLDQRRRHSADLAGHR